MTLDELASTIASVSVDPVVQRMVLLLAQWKEDDTSVETLRTRIERYIGNSWIEQEEVHKTVYALWSTFVRAGVDSIAGMTMNERLFVFGLASRFDAAPTQQQRKRICAKLLAKP